MVEHERDRLEPFDAATRVSCPASTGTTRSTHRCRANDRSGLRSDRSVGHRGSPIRRRWRTDRPRRSKRDGPGVRELADRTRGRHLTAISAGRSFCATGSATSGFTPGVHGVETGYYRSDSIPRKAGPVRYWARIGRGDSREPQPRRETADIEDGVFRSVFPTLRRPGLRFLSVLTGEGDPAASRSATEPAKC